MHVFRYTLEVRDELGLPQLIPVHEIQVKRSRSGQDDSLIRLHVAYPRGGDTIVLRASNIREAKAWGDAILDASKKALEGIRNVVCEPGGI